MTNKQDPSDKVFETSTIRLTVEEARMVIKARQAEGAVAGYQGAALVDMGIMKSFKDKEDKAGKIADEWSKAKAAVNKKDWRSAKKYISNISEMEGAKPADKFILTDLGKQIARGITIKLGQQYK